MPRIIGSDGIAQAEASGVHFTPDGSISSTNVQDAIVEVRDEAGGAADQAEIDFGATPVPSGEFTITDAGVSPSSTIVGSVAYEAPTGKSLDELEFDNLLLQFQPGTGDFLVRAVSSDGGSLAGNFKINYVVV